MKRPALLLLIVGLFAALAAGGLVYFVSSSAVAKTAPPPPPTPVPTATAMPMEVVVVAAKDIPARHVVTAADVVTRSFPVGVAPEDRDARDEVISHTATMPILAGEMLVTRQFVNAGGYRGLDHGAAGQDAGGLPGDRHAELDGRVHAGDHVDILITLPVSGTTAVNARRRHPARRGTRPSCVTQATMQNIEIYSTGIWTPTGPAADRSSGEVKMITFIVDHQEALILKYIKDSGGTIDLGVRSIADTDTVTTDPGIAGLPGRSLSPGPGADPLGSGVPGKEETDS